MKINLNMDRLMDMMMEADNASFDYHKSSKAFYRKHGYGVMLDKANTEEEKHIVYAYNSEDKLNVLLRRNDIVWSIIQVLDFDKEQTDRLYAAYRAVKRWYEKETKWQRCLPDDLIERLTAFIVGASA